jgi:hypothetical protein
MKEMEKVSFERNSINRDEAKMWSGGKRGSWTDRYVLDDVCKLGIFVQGCNQKGEKIGIS